MVRRLIKGELLHLILQNLFLFNFPCTQFLSFDGLKGAHSKLNYKTLNETTDARSQQFFENQLSMRSHTKFGKFVFGRYQYFWKKLLTNQYFSFESVHGEAMLKMGWVVKKGIF